MIPRAKLTEPTKPINPFYFEQREDDLAHVGWWLMIASCAVTGTFVYVVVSFFQTVFAQ